MKPRFTFSIRTLGCKANVYDSLVMEQELTSLGGARTRENPDMVIVNSCTVTAEADKQSLREAALAKRDAPETWTLLTGCMTEVATEKAIDTPHVDACLPNHQKSRLRRLVAERFGLPSSELQDSLAEIYWGQIPALQAKTRAFLKIQEGCNDRCTYCIIPMARGVSRSVPLSRILDEARRLADHGVREIVLTGTNLGDYESDGEKLEDLIEALLTRTQIPRLRVSSLDPSEISDRLLSMIGLESSSSPRLLPHLHISLQSPVSRVLRAMKRFYRTEEVCSALERIHQRSDAIYVGMDLIAGFPSETAAEFEEGQRILAGLPWTKLHVFPYSEREGTAALRIPDAVPLAERKARAKEWMKLSHERHAKFARSFLGKPLPGVLFESAQESPEGTLLVGHAPNYLRCVALIPRGSEASQNPPLRRIADFLPLSLVPKPSQDWSLEGTLSLTQPALH